jgi:hypothetical protein
MFHIPRFRFAPSCPSVPEVVRHERTADLRDPTQAAARVAGGRERG